MGGRPETHGLHEVGEGCYAYLQPDGRWGWNNAGLITGGGRSLVVDTLYDPPKTRRMLDAMAAATDAAREVDALVYTHANGDHCYGGQALARSTILATEACAEEMPLLPPSALARNVKMARVLSRLPWPLARLPMGPGGPAVGDFGAFLLHCFGAFEFDGVELVLPDQVFTGEMDWAVGDRTVRLIEVGPAHTRGDLLVVVEDAGVVFAGDILFHEVHPILWAGPVGNWIAACDRILEMDVEAIVPGHGPVVGNESVRSMKQYLCYIRDEARTRFDAGLPADEAARDIALADYDSWGDAERIVINVDTLYREFAGETRRPDPKLLMMRTAKLWAERRR